VADTPPRCGSAVISATRANVVIVHAGIASFVDSVNIWNTMLLNGWFPAVRTGPRRSLRATPATPATRVRRKRADQYHHGDLRRALLEQAVRSIQLHGVDELTLRGVGRDLGVSRTALYRHFADKAALVEAVAAQGFRTLRERLNDAWTQGGEGRGGFDAMAAAYVRFALDQPSHYRVMFGGALDADTCDPDLTVEGAAAFQALVDAITWQQREGILRDDDPWQLANYVWAIVHGISMLALDGRLRSNTTRSTRRVLPSSGSERHRHRRSLAASISRRGGEDDVSDVAERSSGIRTLRSTAAKSGRLTRTRRSPGDRCRTVTGVTPHAMPSTVTRAPGGCDVIVRPASSSLDGLDTSAAALAAISPVIGASGRTNGSDVRFHVLIVRTTGSGSFRPVAVDGFAAPRFQVIVHMAATAISATSSSDQPLDGAADDGRLCGVGVVDA
jgi:AcrR family transcriptional regulator